MQTLTNTRFMVFQEGEATIVAADAAGLPISAHEGHAVESYLELLEKVAILAYHNSRYRLLFRGQRKDYKFNMRGETGTHSCLYPTVLRPALGQKRELLLDEKFERLRRAEALLMSALRYEYVHHMRIVRWAILQHYEVCDTPLLDVTQSLQSAISFAALQGSTEAYLFVLAVPQLTGPITVSTESMTQTIDLAQVCPPEALRPHFQSGVLIGDYPEYDNRHQTHNKKGFLANNFACRLITKFRLTNIDCWQAEGFNPTPKAVLFPNGRDPWYPILQSVKGDLGVA